MKRSITIIALFLPLLLWAKNPTVSGYVTDVQTGERLIGATVQDMRSGVGTVTNVNGFYSLTIPSDTIQLQAGYVGYDRTLSEAFMLDADTLVEMMLVSASFRSLMHMLSTLSGLACGAFRSALLLR